MNRKSASQLKGVHKQVDNAYRAWLKRNGHENDPILRIKKAPQFSRYIKT